MSVFNKCEYARKQLPKELKTNINYLGSASDEEANKCVVDVMDGRLHLSLQDTGHMGSLYGAISSFTIDKNHGIESSDIVVNTQSCKKTEVSKQEILGLKNLMMMGKCKVEEVHFHDGDDSATHIHIACPIASNDVIHELAKVIERGFAIGRKLCGEDWGRT